MDKPTSPSKPVNTVAGGLGRAWRHLITTDAAARRAFPPAALSAIGAAITAGEQIHRSELRVVIEAAMPFDLIRSGTSNRARALALFAALGVWDTEDNCGVLIYINLAERQVDIVADRGIDRKIDAAAWRAVCQAITAHFAQGRFDAGALAGVAQVNDLLCRHFPAGAPRANELPDQPILL